MSANFLAGALFLAFIVFITIKGKLGAYLGLIGIGAQSQTFVQPKVKKWPSSP